MANGSVGSCRREGVVVRTGALLCLFLFMSAAARAANSGPLALTLDDYVSRAIQKGVQGLKNQWSLETAGYTREIAFRQTDSPTMSAGYTQTRAGNDINGLNSASWTREKTLTINEPTPLGTTATGTAGYGDGEATDATGASTTGTTALSSGKPSASLSVTQPLYIFVHNPVLRARRKADLISPTPKA